ncbi:MAG: gluconate 2-dehydrogenase subunit 3 family protein, partial [Deltaproteobacteria bacterium]|nr:gluconate 2-dehydrogenase subunit 3 family protein [Deltaproteobacteria bacterium]
MTTATPLSRDALHVLVHVLDDLVPPSPDGRLPGAGALGLAPYLDHALDALPGLKDMVAHSLLALDAFARRRNGGGLDAMSPEQRSATLAEFAGTDDALPPILAIHAYSGYYQHPIVLQALGLEPRPPHPLGY